MNDPAPVTQNTEQHELEKDDGLQDVLEGVDDTQGELRFRGWRIHYVLDMPAGELVDEEKPAEVDFYGNAEEQRLDLIVRIWEGVPEAFRKIILYHEAQEATLAFGDARNYVTGGSKVGQMDLSAAHIIATRLHHAYAKKVLSPEEHQIYLAWDRQQKHF